MAREAATPRNTRVAVHPARQKLNVRNMHVACTHERRRSASGAEPPHNIEARDKQLETATNTSVTHDTRTALKHLRSAPRRSLLAVVAPQNCTPPPTTKGRTRANTKDNKLLTPHAHIARPWIQKHPKLRASAALKASLWLCLRRRFRSERVPPRRQPNHNVAQYPPPCRSGRHTHHARV